MKFLGISNSLFLTLALSLGGAVVLLYLFRLRRRRVHVPYAALWERLLQQSQVRSFWKRLRRILSMVLQLLVFAAILFALRDPQPEQADVEGRNVVLIIDTSASMAALDLEGGRDRIEQAKAVALDFFERLETDDNIMIVRADAQLQPLTPFVRPSSLLRESIETLDYTATRGDLVTAVEFAVRSLEGRTRPELVVITDGAMSDETASAISAIDVPVGMDIKLYPVGRAGGNVAITAFNVRRYPENRLNYEVFAEVSSFVDVPVTVELALHANDRMIDRILIELGPNERKVHIEPNLPTGGRRLEAHVRIISGDANDVFPLDDVAYALLPDERKIRVLLVTDGNLLIEAPFLVNLNYELRVERPSQYDPERVAQYDVVVFDDVAPPIPAQGRFLYFHPTGEDSPWEVRGEVRDPIIDSFRRSDPLMQYQHNMRSIKIETAARLRTTDADVRVASAIRGDPMIIRRVEEDRRMVAVAFRPEQSDYTLRVGYPLFVLNAIDWLVFDDAPLLESYRTGQAVRILAPSERLSNTGVLISPGGEEQPIEVTEGAQHVTIYPEFPGFYRILWDDLGSSQPGSTPVEATPDTSTSDQRRDGIVETLLAANLSDLEESQIAPHPEPPFAEEYDEEVDSLTALFGHVDPWVVLVLIASALLLFEWATYNRRVTV